MREEQSKKVIASGSKELDMRIARKYSFLFLITLLMAIGCNGLPETSANTTGVVAPAMTKVILQNTVSIRILAPYMDSRGNRLFVLEEGREYPVDASSVGLGTIVTSGAGSYIVTTDHYKQLSASIADVIITDSTGKEIMLSIETFRGLIRYQNNSVIILVAPPGLPAGTQAADGDRVWPGSTVEVVHRQPANGELSVVDALVEEWIDYRGVESYQLRNLSGDLIEPGNSGGGVWFQGRLVGSIHRTILTDERGEILKSMTTPGIPSHLSYATRLSPERMPLLGQGQPIAALPECLASMERSMSQPDGCR